MNQTGSDNTQSETLLPADPFLAVKKMVDITAMLNELLDKEAMALATSDTIMFSALQDEKNAASKTYEQAANEFTARVQSFRGVEATLLDEMERKQDELQQKAKASQKIMQNIIDRFKERTTVQDAVT